ncbi:hypothetical protein PQO03_00140 [Lentisphaera profundi]|uniref:Uncharacterized protein n=1 Tax=Lentisphaera profundi TaxID=1658616 RepID=A0ABY7VQT8_9BACT|nr:hypothetical protein [Lentisphaera profundi]WDE96377.1 hypothetical protein PQO03_00140 [Lentisphaera profundi]
MSPEEQWKEYFHKLRRKVNTGWFLQSFEPLFLFSLMSLTAVNLYIKSYQPGLINRYPYLIEILLLLFLCCCSIGAYFRARKKFFTQEELIIRYDERYHYNCQLLKAYQGDQSWPNLPDHLPGNFILEWKRNSSFFLFGILLIAAIYWVPVRVEAIQVKVQKPIAWIEMEKRIDEMEEDSSLDQSQVEEFKKKLEKLQQEDNKDWFSHSNLEASNSLLDTLNSAHKEHEGKMDEASQLLQQMEALQELIEQTEAGNIDLSEKMKQKLRDKLDEMDEDWKKNMSQLSSQLLKMRPDLREKLLKLKPGDYVMNNGQLDKKTLEECLKRLEKKGKCKKCGGKGCKPGDQEGEGQCKNGSCNAGLMIVEGGESIGRGGGSSEEIFRDRESARHDTEIEVLQGEKNGMDGSTLLGTSKAEHDLEKNKYKSGQLSAGTKNTGRGGEAVWKENLLPEEQKLLRRVKP